MDEVSHSLQTLKELDPDRYLACLYLPIEIRNDIGTIWAFDAEISRIPLLVSEPMPGEIRLQWWRDLIKTGTGRDAGPLGAALLDVIAKHDLPRETFHNYLEARTFDLYNDPMPDNGTFEGYLGETVSIHFQNAGMCAGIERSTLLADACGHTGMAIGVIRILGNFHIHKKRRQVFVPLNMLAKRSLKAEDWLGDEIFEEHLQVVEDLIQLATYHLTFSKKLIEQLPKHTRALFLQLGLVEPGLKQARKLGPELFNQPVRLSPVKRHWALFKAATTL